MADKILTVVVPTYNMEKYLDRCLTSLILDDEDKMAMLEVLVVNDGSKDRSSEIAHGYEAKYPGTFRVIDKENGNYGSCVNLGLAEASGRYFRILDADDQFCTKELFPVLDYLSVSDVDLLFTPYVEIFEDRESLLKEMPNNIEYGKVYSIDDYAPYVEESHMQMHGMTFRMEVLRAAALKLQEGISYTDTEYCFLPLDKVHSIAALDACLYQYTADRDGQTMSKSSVSRSLPALVAVADRILKVYESNKSLSDVVNAIREKIICRLLELFYWASLLQSRKIPEVESNLKAMDAIVSMSSFAFGYSDNLSLNKARYVHIWRKTGLYNTSPLFVLYNWCWKIIYKIKHKQS